MNRHEDHRYIEALRNENQGLINEIYKNHAAQVSQWICKNNGNISDAKDIFQEGIIAIYNKALDPNFQLNCPLGALLFTICRNKWTDQLRKKSTQLTVRTEIKERLYNDPQINNTLEQVEEAAIRDNNLDRTFQQLSELCQQLLTLVAKGITPTEIALQLEMNETNTVYRRKKACTDRWRELFKNKIA